MNDVIVFSNGSQLFTLNNYSESDIKSGISVHSKISKFKARQMHSNGLLHYITGKGDLSLLLGKKLYRGAIFEGFKIN